MTWDSEHGRQKLELAGRAGTQTILLDGRDETYDVLSSELRDIDGKVVWSVSNTDFALATDDAGLTFRVPGKTRFRSPDEKADLIVEWKSRDLNVTLPPLGFTLEPPVGLPRCGAK